MDTSLTKKLLVVGSCQERKNQFSSEVWHRLYQPHSRVGLMLSSSCSTQNGLHFFVYNYFCYCLVDFFSFFGFCLFGFFSYQIYFGRGREKEPEVVLDRNLVGIWLQVMFSLLVFDSISDCIYIKANYPMLCCTLIIFPFLLGFMI